MVIRKQLKERAKCGEEKKEESGKCCHLWEKNSVSKRKKHGDFSLAVRHIQEIYYNWFDNSEIIRNLSRCFTLQRERVFHVVRKCDCYFGLVIFVIIFLGPNTYASY